MRRACPSTRGFTLIEVVAALAILGGLLTAASLARGRLVRQDRVSRDRQLAVSLLERWADRRWDRREEWAAWAAGRDLPGEELELLDEDDPERSVERGSAWRLELEAVDALEPPVEGVTALRLRVVGGRRDRRQAPAAPLAVLDVLVPAAPPEAQRGGSEGAGP